MKKLFTREILLGLILVFSLTVLFVGIDFLKGINVFKATNEYYASFKDVSGLTVASPVTLNGLKVGQVTDIRYDYDNPGHVLVEINLDQSVKVTHGSKLELASSLLGSAELKLNMAPGADYYEKGEEIPGVKPDDLMANISHEVLPEIVKILPRLNSIVANIDSLSSNPALYSSVSRLDAISRNVEVLTAELAAVSGKTRPVLDNAETLTANLAVVSSDLKELSAQLKALPINETMDNVKTTSGNLADFTKKINGKESTFGLLLNDDGLYRHIDSTISNLDSILIDLKANPKKYVQFKLL